MELFGRTYFFFFGLAGILTILIIIATSYRCESKVSSATREGARNALVGHSAVRHVELSDVLEEVDPLSRDLAARLYLNSGPPPGAAKATAAAV